MRILTGIQPTNILHIGNYFGALKPAVDLQKDNDLFMMVVDLHAITVPQDPKKLHENILFATACYLAAGIDPKKTVLFQQSQIAAHAELAWILQTMTKFGELERMTQFKDKSSVAEKALDEIISNIVKETISDHLVAVIGDKKTDTETKTKLVATLLDDKFAKKMIDRIKEAQKNNLISVGLFTYPVLMAADILLYDAESVPVGEDQKQHIELTRNLAARFNKKIQNDVFTIPEPLVTKTGGRILGLDNPEVKMSKSAASAKNYISLMDDAETIRKKIKSAVTDSERTITVDDNRPGLKNLLTIYHLVTKESMVNIAKQYEGKGMKELKEDLAEVLVVYLEPLQAEIKGLLKHQDELEKVLKAGSEQAETVANSKIKEVKKCLGLSVK